MLFRGTNFCVKITNCAVTFLIQPILVESWYFISRDGESKYGLPKSWGQGLSEECV